MKKAFTLIELLVVVAIIALLLSVLMPSLSGAREQGKRAKCLAHLSGVAKAMHQYAGEDSAEQIIPIHQSMIQKGVTYWEWKTINWFAWGGRSGQKTFKTGSEGGFLLDDTTPPDGDTLAKPQYAAHRRPLTRYMVRDMGEADRRNAEQFSCPGDKGYPDDALIDDSPLANAERSCYETIGSSFRASMYCYVDGQTMGSQNGAFAIGPWGHRLTTLVDVGRLVLCGEPTWFNMIGQDSGGTAEEVKVYGWHRRKMMDNLAFCDGSARTTLAERMLDVNAADFGITSQSNADCIRRGTTFRLDVYPVGGARIFGNWQLYINRYGEWPWLNHQDNFRTD